MRVQGSVQFNLISDEMGRSEIVAMMFLTDSNFGDVGGPYAGYYHLSIVYLHEE